MCGVAFRHAQVKLIISVSVFTKPKNDIVFRPLKSDGFFPCFIICLVHHCLMSLGLENGRIQDGAMTASSVYNNYHAAKLGRLNLEARAGNAGAWCVKKVDAHQWLQIDLGGGTTVTKIVTQGRQDSDQWVTSYAISYSPVNSNWVYVMIHGKKKVYGCTL